MKKGPFRVWKIIGLLLLLPVFLLGILQTPQGKAMLASSLSRILSNSENLDVRIGKISGWIPAEVNISNIEIGDAQGIWLTGRDLHFRWMIREVADERIYLKRLSAEEIELLRFPKTGKKDSVTKKGPSKFQLLEIQLGGLRVKKLKLAKGIAGVPLEYSVHSGGITLNHTGQLSGMLSVTGDAEGRVELDALLAGNGADRLTILAELKQMNKPTFGVDHLSGYGLATISAKGVEAVIKADLKEGDQTGHISANLYYAARRLQLNDFKFNGADVALSGKLGLEFSKGLVEVDLDSSLVDATTNRYELSCNAAVVTSNKTWAVEVRSLAIRGWETITFTLAGKLNHEEVSLAGDLDEFDIGQFPLFGMSNFTGTVNGKLSVTGSLAAPQVVAGVKVSRFSSAKAALDELPELDFRIVGGVVDGQLFASTMMTNYSSGFLSADFAMPCSLSLAPFNYKPQPAGFKGKLDADLDFGIFNNLAILENQIIEGKLKTSLSVENQITSGYLKLTEGRYEHYDWGLVFYDLTADLAATKNGFEFKHASATDGHDGGLSLSGGFGKGGLDVHLMLDRAKVLKRPEVEAQVSGQLNLTGSALRPDVDGTLVIDRAEILIDNMVVAKPLVLTDFDAHAATNAVPVAKEHKPLPFGMDVRIEMPDQIYVVAGLIDSVWGGVLQVKDTPAGVSVSGKVEPRRGYVNFIGKKFRFHQVGEVILDGAVPPMPTFNNLTAEYTRGDFSARLVLNGRANDPNYHLESTPPMPEDEILSNVLFNRDTTTISPYQAYQIAAAAQQLSGGLNGPGFMYQFRQAVGIDTLEWREADAAGGSSTVAAGKYITPGLYVEVSSSFNQKEEAGMMAEYEITRHFSIETSTGPKMRPGIGVNWKMDY
ncbi:MAG: translocation/assembly module TamB domain-containing protein [Pontiella sp.]